jgi:hypothetical protein
MRPYPRLYRFVAVGDDGVPDPVGVDRREISQSEFLVGVDVVICGVGGVAVLRDGQRTDEETLG